MIKIIIAWIIKATAYAIVIILNPACWIQNDGYSGTWDEELNRLMKGERFVKTITRYHATIGGHLVWISNHPYSSFTTDEFGSTVRPRRLTILRAHKKLMRDFIRQTKEER